MEPGVLTARLCCTAALSTGSTAANYAEPLISFELSIIAGPDRVWRLALDRVCMNSKVTVSRCTWGTNVVLNKHIVCGFCMNNISATLAKRNPDDNFV